MVDKPPNIPATDPADALAEKFFSSEPLRRSHFWAGCQSLCRLSATLLFDFKVFGMEHVPKTGGAIIASNHQSNIDPVLLGARLRRPVTYIAKVELFKSPLSGWLMRGLHAFPVRRGAGDVGAVRQAIQLLQGGYLLNFFPEGTRSRDGEIGPIQPGIALVVKRAGVPVIPAAIDGADERTCRDGKFVRKVPVYLQYGPPISFDKMKGEQIVTVLGDTLRRMLTELRAKRREIEGR